MAIDIRKGTIARTLLKDDGKCDGLIAFSINDSSAQGILHCGGGLTMTDGRIQKGACH
jgi:hypothetical protein